MANKSVAVKNTERQISAYAFEGGVKLLKVGGAMEAAGALRTGAGVIGSIKPKAEGIIKPAKKSKQKEKQPEITEMEKNPVKIENNIYVHENGITRVEMD